MESVENVLTVRYIVPSLPLAFSTSPRLIFKITRMHWVANILSYMPQKKTIARISL